MGRTSSSGISTMRCNHVAIGAERLAAAPYRTRRTAPPPSGASEEPSWRMGRMSSSGLRDDARVDLTRNGWRCPSRIRRTCSGGRMAIDIPCPLSRASMLIRSVGIVPPGRRTNSETRR